MTDKTYIAGVQVRVKGRLYPEGSEITCDPADLAGVEHCVKPKPKGPTAEELAAEAAAKAQAEREAEEAAKAEAAAAAKAQADEKAKAKTGSK